MTTIWFHGRRWRSLMVSVLVTTLLAVTGCCGVNKRPYLVPESCPAPENLNVELCPDRPTCRPCDRKKLICYLHLYKVQVTRVGENVRVIIPSDLLFKAFSANYRDEYLPVIDGIAKYLLCFKKVDVKVAGYTDCCGTPERNKMLSLLQAQHVSKYLWKHGVDTRLLHSVGYGREKPIARQQHFFGRAKNRRIEITFRDILLKGEG